MNSALYKCTVRHQRLSPKRHEFEHKIFMCYLDLDELELLSQKNWLFSHNRKNFYSFLDSDHLPGGTGGIKRKVLDYLGKQGIDLGQSGKVRLLTLPRVMGYIFNPVSFYFCFDAAENPVCVLVEVGNTFREMKLFLLGRKDLDGSSGRFEKTAVKHFYVSPFSDLDLSFEFKIAIPDDKLEIWIDDRGEAGKVLLSQLFGDRKAFNNANLVWFSLLYPLVTLKVIFLIHWHALLLYLKRVPFHRKASDIALQQDVLNPHASLAKKT